MEQQRTDAEGVDAECGGVGGTLAGRVHVASVSAQNERVRVREMRHVLCALDWPGVVIVQGGA